LKSIPLSLSMWPKFKAELFLAYLKKDLQCRQLSKKVSRTIIVL
jgi:hypothetical protein